MRPRPAQPFDTPLSGLPSRPPRPRLRRLALMVREAQQLDVRRIKVRAAIAPLDDMISDDTVTRTAAFAPVAPLALDLGDQRPPFAGQIEGISNLGWRLHPRAKPADPWCDILELAHHQSGTGANRSPHPFRFLGERKSRGAEVA